MKVIKNKIVGKCENLNYLWIYDTGWKMYNSPQSLCPKWLHIYNIVDQSYILYIYIIYCNKHIVINSPVTMTATKVAAVVMIQWRQSRRRYLHRTLRAWSRRKNCCQPANRWPTWDTWPTKWPDRLWWPTATSTTADP